MAAIVQPHRHPAPRPARPDLRLVHGTGGASPAMRLPSGAAPWLAVAALVLVMFGAVAIGRGAFAGLAPAPSTPARTPAAAAGAPTVVVRAGDTMWSIARRLQPTGDIRALVDRLVAANGAELQAGDRIVVPQ